MGLEKSLPLMSTLYTPLQNSHWALSKVWAASGLLYGKWKGVTHPLAEFLSGFYMQHWF